MTRLATVILTGAAALSAAAAQAEIPEPVRAMIDAAIASGDAGKVATVIDLAKQTNPDHVEALDSIHGEFKTKLAAEAAAAAQAEEEAIRTAGLFSNWSGKGELGGFRATGNSSNTGITASVALKREGIDWKHNLRARAEYQRNNGVTSRERFLFGYEPNYNISDRLFLYGLAQYERNRFQGFSARYAISGGVGYKVFDEFNVQLSVKAGPAYRVTEFVAGNSESRIAALAGLDFDWTITDRLKLTHDTNAVAETGGSATLIIDSTNTTLDLVTGLNAKISDRLSARFSYAIEYDSNPPARSVSTDTLSRVTLIYDF